MTVRSNSTATSFDSLHTSSRASGKPNSTRFLDSRIVTGGKGGGDSRRVRVSDMELDAGGYVLSVDPENRKGQPAMELEAVVLHRIGE